MFKPLIYIDITDSRYLFLVLERDGKREIKKISRSLARRRLNILARLEKFLTEKKMTVEKLGGLVLLEGTGSFSEVRLTAAVLNALYLTSGVLVFGLDKRGIGSDWPAISLVAQKGLASAMGTITPIYSGEPNVTIPKIKV